MQAPKETLINLGIDMEDIRERVIDHAARICSDPAGAQMLDDSTLRECTERAAQDRIDDLFKEHVAPKLNDLIVALVFPKTNTCGKAKGDPLTFRESVLARIDAYLHDPVDMDGRSRKDGGRLGLTQTRLVYMVERHFHRRISNEIEKALKDVNAQLAAGIIETARMKLAELLGKLKVKTTF